MIGLRTSGWYTRTATTGLLLAGLAGCTNDAPTDTAAEYLAALDRTASAYSAPAPGSAEEAETLARIEEFFRGLGDDDVAERVAAVYAPTAWFNDTLVTLEGADAIAAYFAQAAQRTSSVEVEFIDIARAGDEYYVKWVMNIRSESLRDGSELRSAGVSHLRLDAAGKILLHQDFWDSAGGLLQHLPVAGSLIGRLRERLTH